MTIRRVPEDFAVEELTNPGFLSGLTMTATGGRHLVYRLKKRSLSTPEAVGQFSKAIGAKAGIVDYAGLKDKHAVTTQLVSLPRAPHQPEPARVATARGWSAEFVGWSERPVTAEVIEGNRFVIVVRDLTRKASDEMDTRARRMQAPRLTVPRGAVDGRLMFINYFGEQRFGSARHGKGFAAKHLARAEFEQALRLLIATPARKDSGKRRTFTRIAAQMWGDWNGMLEKLPRCAERGAIEALSAGKGFREAFAELPHFDQQMCVEAYQSWIWNRAAECLVQRSSVAQLATQSMPMLADGVCLLEPWKACAEKVLDQEGLRLEELRVPGLRRPAFGTADRALVTEATGFSLGAVEDDELSRPGRLKRVVRFALSRGAYATVLLRALGQ